MLSIKTSPAFSEKYNIHQAIVECLFSEMMRLPCTSEKLVYYSILLMELCKGALDKVPSAMGRGLKILFDRMDGSEQGMDVECVKRLSEWFAHHLSNFGYSWKWDEWTYVAQHPDSAR